MSEKQTDPIQNEERSYIAFISYRHRELDREAAIALQKKIEHFKVPKEFRGKTKGDRLGYVFRDEDELPTSSSLSDSIRYALDHTEFLIVICTPDLPASKWCEEEIRYFLSTHDRDHLLAVLVKGEPEESFSPYMTNIYDENGEVTGTVEPLAANITGTDEHYSRAKFKKESTRICAALIGCPFDELWQRERRYQNKRKVIFASVAFAAMAVFAIVVGMKNLQINAKNAEITEQNRQISEQNLQITEQNEEITDKNKELQVREGKLLSDAGELLLEGHDLKGAAQSAEAALSMEGIHTEGTELLLSNALGAYSAETLRLDTAVAQETAIDRCVMLSDGSMTFTTDHYGIVRAFSDRTEQWSFSTVPSQYLTEYLNDSCVTNLFLVDNETILLAGNRHYIVGLSPKTGEKLWEVNKINDVDFLAVSPDGSLFAVFNDFTDDCVSFRSVKNGRPYTWFYLPKITLKDGEGNSYSAPYTFLETALTKGYGGCFSPDGKYFMFGAQVNASFYKAYFENPDLTVDEFLDVQKMKEAAIENEQGRLDAGEEEEEEDAGERQDLLVYMIVDLEEQSIRMIGNEPIKDGLNTIFGCSYNPENEQLFFVRYDDAARSVYAGTFDQEGNVSYNMQKVNLRMKNSSVPWTFKEGKKTIAVSAANNLYIFEKDTGAYAGRYELDRNIVYSDWVSYKDDFFLAFQEDGIYHAYHLAENGPDLNMSFREGFPLNNLTYAVRTGDGIFRWNSDGERLESSNGKLLLLSADSPEKVMVGEAFTDPAAVEIRTKDDYDAKTCAFLSDDGKELYLAEQKTEGFALSRIDPESGECLSRLLFKDMMFLQDFPLSIYPGGEKILYGNQFFHSDGSVECLEYTDPDWSAAFNYCAVMGQTAQRDVYTGIIIEDALSIWKNETALSSWDPDDGRTFNISKEPSSLPKPKEEVLLKAGNKGQIVVGTRTTSEKHFSAYDIIIAPDEKAVTVESSGGALPDSILCIADDSLRFAVLEEDGVIRVYDPDQEKLRAEITSPDGFTGVVDLGFADSGRILGVLRFDGKISLYDAKTGQLLGQDTNSGLATEYGKTILKMAVTKDGKRLICIASEINQHDRSNGAVYDLTTFEHVADIPNLVAFSSEYDNAVLDRRLSTYRKFFICPLHNTQNLMEWAE